MKEMYGIYAVEMDYPVVGVTDNTTRVIYESYKKEKERNIFYEWTINNKWEIVPEYRNVIDFYKRWIIKKGMFPGLKGHRCWAFRKIENY